MKKVLEYLKNRFVNGEKTTYVGVGLSLLYLLGYVSPVQIGLISEIAATFGYDIPLISDFIAGAALVAIPEKKK